MAKKAKEDSKNFGCKKLKPEIVARIEELVKEAENLPLPEINAFGWKDHNMRQIILHLLNDCILNRELSSNSTKAIEEFHWKGDVLSLYREINNPTHPIRNYLIRNETDLLYGDNILEFNGY